MRLRESKSNLEQERESSWRLSYFRKNALLGVFLGSAALGFYSLVWGTTLGLIVSGLGTGIWVYLMSHPKFQQYLGAISLLVLAPSFLLFSISSAGLPRSIYLPQIAASTVIGLFGAPWLEQLVSKWSR